MGSLNSASVDARAPAAIGNIADPVTIVFREGTSIIGRKPGAPYVVDGSLAHHYCEVLNVADREGAKAPAPAPPPPVAPQDRAMQPPPRGRRGRED